MSFLEQLADPLTLRTAWQSVAKKRGMPGIDRVSVEDFATRFDQHLAELCGLIRSSSYRPLPVLRIRPSFLAASDRALVVPAVRDRVVHRAITDLLGPKIDPTLSPACRAFRKGSSALHAADDVGRWVARGTPWVLRTDVRKFFDGIRRDVLLQKLEPFVDPPGLAFLDRVLECRVFDHHQITEMVDGIAQGSPLSPLLGNLYLSELDHALVREYPETIRYCDDLIVLCADESGARSAQQLIEDLLQPLGLELNQEKTRICRAEDGFAFLGYHFDAVGRGPEVKAVRALRFRLEQLAESSPLDLAALDAVQRGWSQYFGPHPEIWLDTPIGALAWLRGQGLPPSTAERAEQRRRRWRRPLAASLPLAHALARAWVDNDEPHHAWLELAMAGGGSQASAVDLVAWGELLGVGEEALVSLLGRCTGSPSDRLTVLMDTAAELGHYQIATHLAAESHDLVAAFDEAADGASLPRSPFDDPVSATDLRLLLDWFQGREGVHAEQTARPSGHRTYLPLHRPLGEDDWRAHLRGEKVLALPLVRSGNSCLVGVLDIDVTRRALEEGQAEELMGRALATALKLRQALLERGAHSLLELSGQKGYHLWLRFAEPVPSHRLRRWLLDTLRSMGPLPEGIRVEELPNRDRVRPEAVGPLIKLPLGVHAKTGRRCNLLDEKGNPLDDPFDTLRSHPRTEATAVAPRPMPPEAKAATKTTPLGPRCRKALDNCRVLRHLAEKSKTTAYLTHRERMTLLCVLGHLGDEGHSALHAIISHTYNYRPEATDRHIARLPEWPISCPKVRELHPEAIAEKPCACQFDLRGKGGYPTPLLHVLRPGEIKVFQKPGKSSDKSPRASTPAAADNAQQHQGTGDPEPLVRKLAELKRHRRGIEKSITQLQAELATLFEQRGEDTLELPLGTLRRKRTDPSGSWDFIIEL